MFPRLKKLWLLLKLKREVSKMKINLTEALALLDAILAGGKIVTGWTPTDKDDKFLAYVQGVRNQLRPLFGAEEGGTEDLPQEIADQVEKTVAQFEIVADQS
jgi:hypothetical protein